MRNVIPALIGNYFPALTGEPMNDLKYLANFELRKALSNCPATKLIKRWLNWHNTRNWYKNESYWNEKLSGAYSSYIDGECTQLRSRIIALHMQMRFANIGSVLDLGCAGGSFGDSILPYGIKRYHGIDISSFAISRAESRFLSRHEFSDTDIRFFASDISECSLVDQFQYDMILFNEILYYFGIEEAFSIVRKYAANLSESGIICISLKNDPKSQGILRLVDREYELVFGFLYQSQFDDPKFRIKVDRHSPAFFITFYRPCFTTVP